MISTPVREEARMGRFMVCCVLIATALGAGPALGQTGHAAGSLTLIGVHPETMADVIVVLEPHRALPLDVPTSGEQVIHGSVLRVERGVVPQLIVNTPNTIVAPLRVGVPVRLYLKSFSNRNAHYIIGVLPAAPNGEKP